MALEIEKKYIVKDDSYKAMAEKRYPIEQGYLCRTPDRTVRVRIKGEKGYLTVKGITQGDTRAEYEYEIPFADAEEMIALCEPPVLEKTRYIINYRGFTWEVDEFHGKLAPLVTAEIELPSSGTPFDIPPFVGEDVTGNPRYFNSNLTF